MPNSKRICPRPPRRPGFVTTELPLVLLILGLMLLSVTHLLSPVVGWLSHFLSVLGGLLVAIGVTLWVVLLWPSRKE